MSITTYGELKTAVGVWLNRTDLTSYIPDFIRLGEQRIYYGSSDPFPSTPLRVPAMQTQATGTLSASSIAFPTRWLEPIRIAVSSGGTSISLQYMPPERFSEAQNSSAPPSAYTYLNNTIQTAGTGAASYTLDYYAAFATLTADADTNWIFSNAPGIYLYAALIESAPFIGDAPMLNGWLAMFKSQIAAVNRATKYQGGGALATRVVQ
jgi:hypothetical protein